MPVTVLHIIPSLEVGGAESQLVAWFRFFDLDRLPMMVLSLSPGGDLEPQLRELGVEVRSFRPRRKRLPQSLLGLANLIRQISPRIIHTHLYNAGVWGRISARLAGVPFMVTSEHGMTLWKRPHQRFMERRLLPYTSKLICVSRAIAEQRHRAQGVPEDKLVVIPNSIDPQEYRMDPSAREATRASLGVSGDEVVVGSVGRLVPVKGHPFLIEAVARLLQKGARVRLMFVGGGPERANLEKLASDKGLGDRTIFVGQTEDVRPYLMAMDIFTLPSLMEGIPLALLEAMSLERPPVVSGVGGNKEVICDPSLGRVVPAGDPEVLAEEIYSFCRDPEVREATGRAARRRIEEAFNINVNVRKIEQIYEELLKPADA